MILISGILIINYKFESSYQFYILFQRQKKFASKYKSNTDLGFFGILPMMKKLIGEDDAFYEYRYDLYRKLGTVE